MRVAATDQRRGTPAARPDASATGGQATRFGRRRIRPSRFRNHIAPLIAACLARRGRCTIRDMGGAPDDWRGETRDPNVEIRLEKIRGLGKSFLAIRRAGTD